MLFEKKVFTGDWSALVWRGIAAILIGIMILVWPAISVVAFLRLIGIFAIIGGILVIIQEMRTKGGWPLLLEGIMSIIVGILVISMPKMSAVVITLLIGFWMLFIGIFQIINLIQFYKALPNPGKWLRTPIRGRHTITIPNMMETIPLRIINHFPGLGSAL